MKKQISPVQQWDEYWSNRVPALVLRTKRALKSQRVNDRDNSLVDFVYGLINSGPYAYDGSAPGAYPLVKRIIREAKR